MSEFYSIRRASITDTTALLAFVVGWLASAPFGWPYIRDGFESGDVTQGVFRFAVIAFGAGISCGLVGYVAGATGGWIWERLHRRWRAQHPTPEQVYVPKSIADEPRGAALPLPPLRYSLDDEDVTAYATLAQRVHGQPVDAAKMARALAATINVSAWDGDRLVGIARVLSDGYLSASLADLLVDPEFQRRGLGRELLNRAYEKTPRGELAIAAPPEATRFFDQVGCERGRVGFVMRRALRPR